MISQASSNLGLSVDFVCKSIGVEGRSRLPGSQIFTQVSTDSRQVEKGALFVPLNGERFDGHDFIEKAFQNGALAAFARKDWKPGYSGPGELIRVDDPLQAYRQLAMAWRRGFSMPILAIAGSVGKTTTKELLAAILRGRWPHLLKTEQSQNGFVGVAMTLLKLRAEHGAAVVEVGIDEIGAMAQHLEVLKPTAAVVTAVSAEHLENLKNIETVAREECLALEWVAKSGGWAAVNFDDARIRDAGFKLSSPKKIAFSLCPGPSLATPSGYEHFVSGKLSQDKSQLVIECGNLGPNFTLACPLPGDHNARNLLAAVSLALVYGLSANEIRSGLETFSPAPGRSQIQKTKSGCRVLCDYYNANPASVRAALATLGDLALSSKTPVGKRWICLGDMLELGKEEESLHRELAADIMEGGFDAVLLFGQKMRWLQDELRLRNYGGKLAHFDSQESLARFLLEEINPLRDLVLIKGSRGSQMERVWAALNENPDSPSHG